MKHDGLKTMKCVIKVSIAAMLLVFTTTSSAADRWCTGKLNEALVYADGTLMVLSTWRNDWTVLCSVKDNRFNIDTVTCSLWASYAMKAVESQLPVVVVYKDITQECNALPTYQNSLAPGYFRFGKPQS